MESAAGQGKGGRERVSQGLGRAVAEWFAIGYACPVRTLAAARRAAPFHEKLARDWSRCLLRRYDVRLQPEPDSAPLLTGRRCLWIAPHRGVADFFVHKEIVEGRGATLSRCLVAGIFPFLWLFSRTDRSVWFFRRDRIHTRESFYRWLDREFERCPLDGLIVYAEGHRNRGREPLPLKAGMIHYAHGRGLPVQVIVAAHTERIVDEQVRAVRHGVIVPYRLEAPIEPQAFPDQRAFYAAVRARFESSFRRLIGGAEHPGEETR